MSTIASPSAIPPPQQQAPLPPPGTQAPTSPQLSTMKRRRIPVTAILGEKGSFTDEWSVREWLSCNVSTDKQDKYLDKSISIASLLKDGIDLCL